MPIVYNNNNYSTLEVPKCERHGRPEIRWVLTRASVCAYMHDMSTSCVHTPDTCVLVVVDYCTHGAAVGGGF